MVILPDWLFLILVVLTSVEAIMTVWLTYVCKCYALHAEKMWQRTFLIRYKPYPSQVGIRVKEDQDELQTK